MSLGQLTANYTDSEGEDDEQTSVGGSSQKSTPIISKPTELKEEGSRKATPVSSIRSGVESGTNTPTKKINRLVSYANDDDYEGEDMDEDDDEEDKEPDEELNSVPMDTSSDEGDEDKPKFRLPNPPPGKCATHLQEKIVRLNNDMKHGNKDYNAMYQGKKEFRNPGIYEKLIELLQLDEMGSNYPLHMFDPHCWGKESYYDELARVQKEEMDKREKERKEKSKTKVDIVSGTKKPVEEERKRKSRFDQAGPATTTLIKHVVAPPTLTSVPSGTKTTIDAFGTLKKLK